MTRLDDIAAARKELNDAEDAYERYMDWDYSEHEYDEYSHGDPAEIIKRYQEASRVVDMNMIDWLDQLLPVALKAQALADNTSFRATHNNEWAQWSECICCSGEYTHSDDCPVKALQDALEPLK